jgi:CBS domain-containing protein
MVPAARPPPRHHHTALERQLGECEAEHQHGRRDWRRAGERHLHRRESVHRLVVIEHGRLCGIVSTTDIVRLLAESA